MPQRGNSTGDFRDGFRTALHGGACVPRLIEVNPGISLLTLSIDRGFAYRVEINAVFLRVDGDVTGSSKGLTVRIRDCVDNMRFRCVTHVLHLLQ